MVLLGLMGSNPDHQPFGAQKFEWNSVDRSFESVWVNREISSPNGVPAVNIENELAYFVGAREDRWTLEALDWKTGQSSFHWVMGDQRYNGLGSAVVLDDEGRVHFGGTWGRVRLNVSVEKPRKGTEDQK